MTKYHFILALYGFIFCLAVFASSLMASDEQKYPFPDLEDAMTATSFNPDEPESFTVVFTADLHYGTGDPDQILPPIIKEISSMKPFPKFFGIAGDLICK